MSTQSIETQKNIEQERLRNKLSEKIIEFKICQKRLILLSNTIDIILQNISIKEMELSNYQAIITKYDSNQDLNNQIAIGIIRNKISEIELHLTKFREAHKGIEENCKIYHTTLNDLGTEIENIIKQISTLYPDKKINYALPYQVMEQIINSNENSIWKQLYPNVFEQVSTYFKNKEELNNKIKEIDDELKHMQTNDNKQFQEETIRLWEKTFVPIPGTEAYKLTIDKKKLKLKQIELELNIIKLIYSTIITEKPLSALTDKITETTQKKLRFQEPASSCNDGEPDGSTEARKCDSHKQNIGFKNNLLRIINTALNKLRLSDGFDTHIIFLILTELKSEKFKTNLVKILNKNYQDLSIHDIANIENYIKNLITKTISEQSNIIIRSKNLILLNNVLKGMTINNTYISGYDINEVSLGLSSLIELFNKAKHEVGLIEKQKELAQQQRAVVNPTVTLPPAPASSSTDYPNDDSEDDAMPAPPPSTLSDSDDDAIPAPPPSTLSDSEDDAMPAPPPITSALSHLDYDDHINTGALGPTPSYKL